MDTHTEPEASENNINEAGIMENNINKTDIKDADVSYKRYGVCAVAAAGGIGTAMLVSR